MGCVVCDLRSRLREAERERDEALAANEAAKQFSYASHRQRAETAEARVREVERERDEARAVCRDGHPIHGSWWNLDDIEKWLMALGADETQRAAVLAPARLEARVRELEEALRPFAMPSLDVSSFGRMGRDIVRARVALAAGETENPRFHVSGEVNASVAALDRVEIHLRELGAAREMIAAPEVADKEKP